MLGKCRNTGERVKAFKRAFMREKEKESKKNRNHLQRFGHVLEWRWKET
jgi:hypothetical protein